MSKPSRSDWGPEAQRLAARYAVGIGGAVTFVLFALIVTPALLRERRAPPAPPSDQPAAASVGWLDQAEAPPSRGKDLPPIDPATVMTPNPKLLARGETLFKQHCTSCHGDGGRGDGPAIATLNPKPRNLTSPEHWTHGHRITDIFATITKGSKGTAMAAYDFIPPADRMALVHYVRALGKFDHGPEDPQALAALADSFRSKGVHIPNRIPASMAIRKMVAEQAPVAPVALPAASDSSSAARLLRRVIVDPAAAARTLAATRNLRDLTSVARAWTAGVPGNGFATALVALDAEEWHTLVTSLLGTELPATTPIDGGVP
jgi:mono/diheme cytochrome c family protein